MKSFVLLAASFLGFFVSSPAFARASRHLPPCPPYVGLPSYNGRILNGVVIEDDTPLNCVPQRNPAPIPVTTSRPAPFYHGRLINGVVIEGSAPAHVRARRSKLQTKQQSRRR